LFVRVVNDPPPGALPMVRLLKSLTGKSSLGLAKRLREIGTQPGYAKAISDELREEIRETFREDNRSLERLAAGSLGLVRVHFQDA
jgi:hypothetical protein